MNKNERLPNNMANVMKGERRLMGDHRGTPCNSDMQGYRSFLMMEVKFANEEGI